MNEPNSVSVNEARARRCPVLAAPATHYYTYAAGSGQEHLFPQPQRVVSVAVSHSTIMCEADRCMMWVWLPGSSDRGYCGLRGKLIVP